MTYQKRRLMTPETIVQIQTQIGPAFPEQERAERLALLNQVVEHGIQLDVYGLIVPNQEKSTAMVASSFHEIRDKIVDAREGGRHVIYIPGSYDLSHAGHASYVLQVTDFYLSEHPELSRDDLYIVMLADDDEMIRNVKAYKHVDFGGKETFRRPIVSRDSLGESLPIHPRLYDLASLPVDLVGFIPSPGALEHELEHIVKTGFLSPDDVRSLLLQFSQTHSISDKDLSELEEAIVSYELLLSNLQFSSIDHVTKDFNSLNEPRAEESSIPAWTVQSWQLLLHQYLGSVPHDFSKIAPMVRIVSTSDDKYLTQVQFLMEISGINIDVINDQEVISTKKLLDHIGPDLLLQAKRNHFLQS